MNKSDEYSARLKNLSNEELIRLLAEGKNAFRDNYYNLIFQEAKDRNLKLDASSVDKVREDLKSEQDMKLAKFGYALAFLGGIAGFVIGIYILAKKVRTADGRKIPRYEYRIRNHGIKILIMGIVMSFIGWPLIGFVIAFIFARL